jgi:hypothetical protein
MLICENKLKADIAEIREAHSLWADHDRMADLFELPIIPYFSINSVENYNSHWGSLFDISNMMLQHIKSLLENPDAPSATDEDFFFLFRNGCGEYFEALNQTLSYYIEYERNTV